jgi:tubulin polyglutamylase TTLL1
MLENLKLYLASTYGTIRTNKLFADISDIFACTLRAVQPNMTSEKHCFECYGFDMLIDANLKPWLIEVNASPAISATTPADKTLKMKLIDDVLNVACCRPPGCVSPDLLGGWSVLVDETAGLKRDFCLDAAGGARSQTRREWR